MLHPFSVAVQPRLCRPNAAQAWAGTCSSSSALAPAPPVNHGQNTNPEVFPAFGMREEKKFFFFFEFFFLFKFFFSSLGVFFVFTPNLSGPLLHFFFSSLHAPAKCFPVCLSLQTSLNHWTVYPQCGHCILTDVLILNIYIFCIYHYSLFSCRWIETQFKKKGKKKNLKLGELTPQLNRSTRESFF